MGLIAPCYDSLIHNQKIYQNTDNKTKQMF